ncbi:hypothetical protein JCM3765_002535 [Sporobolomyces pararoseus]
MNNPFAKQPQSIVDQTAERFPPAEIPSPPPQSQFGGYNNPQYQSYAPPQLQEQYTGYQQQQQQYPQQQTSQFNQVYSQNSGFQNGNQYGQPQFNGGQQQFGGQYGAQGGMYGAPNTSDLDPYASLGNFNNSSQNQNSNNNSPSAILHVQQTQSHPRQFVQENKQGLMSWDEYSWKQLFTRVDALREAWESRVAGIKAAANQGADPVNAEQMKREAESNVDSIHAAKMQMNEVKSGWKHSTDPASKARVREALNAGLSAMPEYPQPINPEQLGGSFYRNASQQYQKASVMSQFNAPTGGGGGGSYYQQQQQTGMMPQMTGFGGYNTGGGGMMQPQQTGYMQPQQTGYGYSGGGYQQQQNGGYGGQYF